MVEIESAETMKIVMSGRGIDVTEDLRAELTHGIHLAISRFGEHVERVTVKLTDLNDPVRGMDKRCRIRVRLLSQLNVIVESTDSDLDAAMDHAVRGIGRVMASRFSVSPDR